MSVRDVFSNDCVIYSSFFLESFHKLVNLSLPFIEDLCAMVYILKILQYKLQFILDEMYINIYDCIATLYNELRLTC